MARRPRPQEGAARCRSRATWASGQAGHPERRCLLVGGEAQRSWRRRLWGGWSSQGSTRPRALSTGSGSREPRRPAGGGLGTDSGSRPSSRQPARKSCPPAPPIAARRWAACRRSRSRLRGQSVIPPPDFRGAGALLRGCGCPWGPNRGDEIGSRCSFKGRRVGAGIPTKQRMAPSRVLRFCGVFTGRRPSPSDRVDSTNASVALHGAGRLLATRSIGWHALWLSCCIRRG